jgi:nucleoside-diphosphate-sugar epimerase
VNKTALIAGASGIVGNNLGRHLVNRGWNVVGLARRPPTDIPGVQPRSADLLDEAGLNEALSGLRPSHVFITTWMRQETEAQNIHVNSKIVRNLLKAVSSAQSVGQVALVTGTKHYLGPFEMYGKGTVPVTPFREESGRLKIDNFYYAQEDEVFTAASRDGFTWSIHRPHTIVGFAIGNAMNMGFTLATYASICREFDRPFLFPGSAVQWNGLTDMTNARLLARHLEWGSTTEAACDEDFNVVNGDIFRWNWMWTRIANRFGLTPAPFPGTGVPLKQQMADAAAAWTEIVRKYRLSEPDLAKLASAWHTDADLGRPIEVVNDMSKSRALGFLDYKATDQSFFDLLASNSDARRSNRAWGRDHLIVESASVR